MKTKQRKQDDYKTKFIELSNTGRQRTGSIQDDSGNIFRDMNEHFKYHI